MAGKQKALRIKREGVIRFFNIDQHISVIADLKHIFGHLGHQIDDWTLSGHAHVMGRERANVPLLNGDNWCGTVSNPDRLDEFYRTYKDEFAKYDGFVVTYPPVFARLWERWEKPIIIQLPIRFDYTLEVNAEARAEWCNWLCRKARDGQVILTANNKLDKHYCENYVDAEVRHIPSMCEYTEMAYAPHAEPRPFLYYAARKAQYLNPALFLHKNETLQHGYKWDALLEFAGIAHFPYQVSTMSIFEQYTANIPMLFPSEQFAAKLYNENLVAMKDMIESHREGRRYWDEGRLFILDQVSFHTIFNRPTNTVVRGRLDSVLGDPNNYLSMYTVDNWWLNFADFYDSEWMPHIQYFESFEDFNKRAPTLDFAGISTSMAAENVGRKQKVYAMWSEILNKMGAK